MINPNKPQCCKNRKLFNLYNEAWFVRLLLTIRESVVLSESISPFGAQRKIEKLIGDIGRSH